MGVLRIPERYYKVGILLLALMLAAGYAHKLLWHPAGKGNVEFGYYAYEDWENGKVRWTGRRTFMRIRAEKDLFGLSVFAQPFNSKGPQGLGFHLLLNGKRLDTVHFFNGGNRSLYYYVPGIKGRYIEIGTEVDRTFTPCRVGLSEDCRELGVAVSPIVFLEIMPIDGVGFYPRESMGADVDGWPGGKKKAFRWTRKRASLNIRRQWPRLRNGETVKDVRSSTKVIEKDKVFSIFLMCGHPDIGDKPVWIKITGDAVVADEKSQQNAVFPDSEILRRVELNRREWKKLEFQKDALEGHKVMTFEVSRTWNPKHMGVSDDARDLGVAVAIP